MTKAQEHKWLTEREEMAEESNRRDEEAEQLWMAEEEHKLKMRRQKKKKAQATKSCGGVAARAPNPAPAQPVVAQVGAPVAVVAAPAHQAPPPRPTCSPGPSSPGSTPCATGTIFLPPS